ncbi:hypothetical protein VitviT2T_016129 [Vitis vinifera]|uniref:GRAM domain-containing protein n=1 Tax=Vitis vinifera TaxID=29760 RepID=A0ABY9CQM1_VITVI|nr:hypothetical protein VitviT2T_016129 [Vitis vinifera]
MKSQLQEHVIGIPVSCQYDKPSLSNGSGAIIQKKWDSTNYRIKKKQEEGRQFCGWMRLGPKFSETVKGKLSLGARILQVGGVKRVFKQIFGVGEGEKLLKASQCYLSTTGGPIAGLLFISSQRIAFCSDRSIKFSSPNGELIRIHYKVSIPLRKIQRANQSENVKNPSQKYMEIVTVDNFDFWFMGFLNYQKAFSYLQQALCEALRSDSKFLPPNFYKLRLGPKISKTVKGKLRLEDGNLQIEGVKSVFKKTFSVGKDEKLLKASSPRVSVKEFWLLFHRVFKLSESFQLSSTDNLLSFKSTQKVIQTDTFLPLCFTDVLSSA